MSSEVGLQDAQRGVKKRRHYEQLPVVICEWHQQVLPHVHRAIASRYLPESGLKMIHFDSHPDLTFPINLPAEECFDKEVLYDEVEIADWILPLIYENHLDEVVWIKPPWADQIREGEWLVSVGEHQDNQFLRISFAEDYFFEELLYEKEDNLCNSKKCKILIRTLSKDKKEIENNSLQQNGIKQELYEEHDKKQDEKRPTVSDLREICNMKDASYILDIDLDFFSTYNPFVLRHNEVHFEELANLYKFTSPQSSSDDDIAESLQNRHRQLKTLQNTVKYFEMKELSQQNYRTDFLNLIPDDCTEINITEINEKYLELLKRILADEKEEGRAIDLELVHFAGMSADLPHHRSTTTEIDQLMLNVEEFLLSQPRPTFVTVARSSEDEYTPPDQVEYIQEKVLSMLESLYNHISVTKDYQIVDTVNIDNSQ